MSPPTELDRAEIEALERGLIDVVQRRAALGVGVHIAVMAQVMGRLIEAGIAEGVEAQVVLGLVAQNVGHGRAAAKAASGRAKAIEDRRVTGASGQQEPSGGGQDNGGAA